MSKKAKKTRSAARPRRQSNKRLQLRDQFWPDAEDKIWNRQKAAGFTTIPRVLSLAAHLIRSLAEQGDPSRAYMELWCRSWDEMMLTIEDEDRHAFAAGYTSTRALRTWRAHIWQLQKLGFIEVQPDGNRDIGYILLIDPYLACAKLHQRGKVSQQWWTAFAKLAADTGATIPEP